jgi:hypothetical protein
MQWRKSYPSGCRLLYLCGEDKYLVAEVLIKELAYRPINPLDYIELDGKTTPVQDIMLHLDQYAKTGYRVVLIRNADQVDRWGPIIDWTKSKEMKETVLICVGNEDKPNTKEERFRPFIKNPQGRYVDCKALNEEQATALVMDSGQYTPEAANTLVWLANGESHRLFNAMKKLAYLDGPVTSEIVKTYVLRSSTEEFVSVLFSGDKRRAMYLVKTLDDKTLAFTMGAIEYALTNMVILSFVRDKSLPIRDIAERTNIPHFLVAQYLQWMKSATISILYRRIKLLANADAYNRKGLSIGVIERLIAMW